MAHVLNRQDRRQAFWKFLFFFLLSTAMIVGAVYFDVRTVPANENTILRDQVFRYKTQAMAQEKFVKSMDDALQLFDSLGRPGANALKINVDITDKIRELAALQYKDSSMYSRLNKSVIDVFSRYYTAAKNNSDMGDLPHQLEESRLRYEQCQRDLDNARRDLEMCRKANSVGTGFD